MSSAAVIEVPGPNGAVRTLRISSPDRLVYPDDAVAKLDLVEYLLAVSQPFLRWSGDRPVALDRYPKGLGEKPFFSKNPPKGAPAYARTVMCTYAEGGSGICTHGDVYLSECSLA